MAYNNIKHITELKAQVVEFLSSIRYSNTVFSFIAIYYKHLYLQYYYGQTKNSFNFKYLNQSKYNITHILHLYKF